jgi:excisionase family DNA binding protein
MGSRRGPSDRKPDLADPGGRDIHLPVQLRIDTPILKVAAVPAWAQFGNQCSTRRCAPAVANMESDPVAGGRLPRLLTVAEVAAGLRVSTRTIRRMIADGQLQAITVRHAIRISEAEYARLTSGS